MRSSPSSFIKTVKFNVMQLVFRTLTKNYIETAWKSLLKFHLCGFSIIMKLHRDAQFISL